MKNLNKMQNELSQEINKFKKASPEQIKIIQNYVGRGSQLTYLGLSLPQTRSILKKNLGIYELPLDEQFKVFEQNWFDSKIHDQKSLSIFWLESLPHNHRAKYAKKILAWATEIDNWAHSDGLCGIYAALFENNPKSTLPIYKKWNSHKNPWLRRCSMVGLHYYSRLRKQHPSFALSKKMIAPHMKAPEYYVQKAVGWTLREMYNVYPAETVQFLENNLKDVSSVAWVAASEKLPLPLKNRLLKKRRLLRKK